MDRNDMGRRQVLQTSVAAGGLLILKPETVFGAQANSAVEIGIVGCGGRGTMMGMRFPEYTGARVVALADLYRDRIDSFLARTKLQVDESRIFLGLNSGPELMRTKLDAVVLETPTYAFPALAEAGVAAGKHVFMAKPVAVDVPGCLRVKEAGVKARGKLSFLVDFQIRARDTFREAVERVRRGDIGEPMFGHVYYHDTSVRVRRIPNVPAAKERMRNWYFYRALAGGLLVSRDIHVLDGANWFMGSHPEKAAGHGGMKSRRELGDCWDYFILTFWYPNGCVVDFSSTEFTTGYRDMCMRFYGSTGAVDSHYDGAIKIGGSNPWPGTEKDETGRLGVLENVKNFIASIKSGKYLNNADDAVDSTLTSLLGMMAAHSGRPWTWQELLRNKERLDPRVEG